MGLGRGGSASSVGTKVPSYSLSARPEGNRDSTERKFIWASEIIYGPAFFVYLDCPLRHKWRRLGCKKKVKMILSSVETSKMKTIDGSKVFSVSVSHWNIQTIMRRCVSWRLFHQWLNEFVFHETNDKQWPLLFSQVAQFGQGRNISLTSNVLIGEFFFVRSFFCKTKLYWGWRYHSRLLYTQCLLYLHLELLLTS